MEVSCHAEERCASQNSLVIVDQPISCMPLSTIIQVVGRILVALAILPMTMAGIRNRSIFLKTLFSTLGSIDLASSPTNSIVGVATLDLSLDGLELAAAALLSRTDDAVMLKNFERF